MSFKTKLSFATKLLMLDSTSWNILRWRIIKGDKTLRLDYPLNTNSLVLDVGGYQGNWAEEIVSKFNCNVMIFEPIKENVEKIRQKFIDNPKVIVYGFGLSNSNREQEISLMEDGSSLNIKSSDIAVVTLRDVVEFLNEQNIHHIHLMKINIEGEEYRLLDALIRAGKIEEIDNLQIQFHDFVPNAINLRNEICSNISKTHVLKYDYPFVWESWGKVPS